MLNKKNFFSDFAFNLKKFNIKNFTKEKLIAILIMIILVVFITIINTSSSEIGAFIRKLPLMKSSWVNYRFLSVIISQALIEKNLGNTQVLSSIIKASLFGVPLQLCSCSVIPVSA